MSISPERGHGPYVELTGSIQMPGQSQSPRGSLAVTSTRPYLIFVLKRVETRADLTGGTMVPLLRFVMAAQSAQRVEEHVVLVELSRLMMLPLVSRRVLSWRVGLI